MRCRFHDEETNKKALPGSLLPRIPKCNGDPHQIATEMGCEQTRIYWYRYRRRSDGVGTGSGGARARYIAHTLAAVHQTTIQQGKNKPFSSRQTHLR